jgi:hypothetical protein
MWGTLVGLIERWWREKPRSDVVRAVVHLRDSMIECQSWYEQYLVALDVGDLDTLDHDPRFEWIRSLTTLTKKVVELDVVLSIFSQEAHQAIAGYLDFENLEFGVEGLEVAAQYLEQPLQLDIKNKTMDETFTTALNELSVFIAKNFKADEIFAASSRWR